MRAQLTDLAPLLTGQGWTMYYSCMCGGSQRMHWSNVNHPGYEIRTRPRRQTFEIRHKNIRVFGPDWGYKLHTALKQFGIYEENIRREKDIPGQ